ncbi:MAG TPA: apolipoprotein N-acyltransferase [Bdellovibrionales bacterium]|nr:apolipoprotein N-acyltransferase [Bdellovibrionales bacterium]
MIVSVSMFHKLSSTDPSHTKSLYASSIISGIMMGTSYIPFLPWAMFFSFIPLLFFWLRTNSLKKILISGWICQFVFTAIGFNWVFYTIREFGNLHWSLALLGALAFFSFANLQIPLAGWIWFLLFGKSKNPAVRVLGLITSLALLERLFPMIFDWHLGYPWLWAGFPAYQLADLIGFFGLSSLTWIFQGIFLYTLVRHSNWKAYTGLGISLAAFAVLNLWGWAHKPQWNPEKQVSVGIIQANIGNLEKQMAEKGFRFRQSILDRYFRLSLEASKEQPDFILWPETAFPDFLTPETFQEGFYGNQVRGFLKEKDPTWLVTGTYSKNPEGKITNSIVVLSKNGYEQLPYHKTHLLAFGEFIPGAHIFPQLKSWLPMVADFARGNGPTVLEVKEVRAGMQICYEGLFDNFSRSLAQKGAEILINVTNDSWFGTWQEPYQHMTMTLARSIEVRLPLIRSTNTGISTVQLPKGQLELQSPMNQEWQHVYSVPYRKNPPLTVFSGFGYWVFPILLVALWAWALIWKRRTDSQD